jgi:hypothetical protein
VCCTHITEEGNFPVECDIRFVRLSRTVCTQLAHYTWIYFAPRSNTLTVLCQNENPVDVTFKGVGKLQIHTGCKGYGATDILYISVNVNSTSTRVKGDLLSQVTLPYNCCEELDIQINFSKLSMDLNYHKTLSHLDDLKFANMKV